MYNDKGFSLIFSPLGIDTRMAILIALKILECKGVTGPNEPKPKSIDNFHSQWPRISYHFLLIRRHLPAYFKLNCTYCVTMMHVVRGGSKLSDRSPLGTDSPFHVDSTHVLPSYNGKHIIKGGVHIGKMNI